MPKFSKTDLAKYPFLKETAEYVKHLDIEIKDLVTQEYAQILGRAKERMEEAVLYAVVARKLDNPEIEISSFPVSVMLAIATEDTFIKKRYALAEAKQVFEDLQAEAPETILKIANNVGWELRFDEKPGSPRIFALGVTDYLRNVTQLRDGKWKLVNRALDRGFVYITKIEVARLLSEEVRRFIEKRLDAENASFPQTIVQIAEGIRKLAKDRIGVTEVESFPTEVVQAAFPPCVNALYQSFESGRHLSHVGRFALTTFLINVGMSSEKVIKLFRSVSDFNERMTKYQVEHIAGEKGSRTRYIPPSCGTLKTHGICVTPDSICATIRHPLTYYRKKSKTTKKGI